MRIISGKIKGKKLLSPTNKNTRPTSDRAREALFNIICHHYLPQGLENINVLDLFAGSGALGLEALSRGAAFAGFVENDAEALSCIMQNIKLCRFEEQSRLIKADALKFTDNKKAAYSLVFMDPPYLKSLIIPSLENLNKQNLLPDNALIVIETAKNEAFLLPNNFEKIDERVYGIAKITFVKYYL